MPYEKPTIIDHGDLTALTAGTSTFGPEDGGDKMTTQFHHSM